jgi:protein-S-isoprenylcysteine O-methyltransferase Ste14
MVDWVAIISACGLAAVIGLGFVFWERYENERLGRERFRRRVPRRIPRRRPSLDVDRWAA